MNFIWIFPPNYEVVMMGNNKRIKPLSKEKIQREKVETVFNAKTNNKIKRIRTFNIST